LDEQTKVLNGNGLPPTVFYEVYIDVEVIKRELVVACTTYNKIINELRATAKLVERELAKYNKRIEQLLKRLDE
jgi:hypothetical protein